MVVSLIDSWRRPMTCWGWSQTRRLGWERATRRWPSPWASWRGWPASCRRRAARPMGGRPSWRKSCCSCRAPWILRGGATVRDQRRSMSYKVPEHIPGYISILHALIFIQIPISWQLLFLRSIHTTTKVQLSTHVSMVFYIYVGGCTSAPEKEKYGELGHSVAHTQRLHSLFYE